MQRRAFVGVARDRVRPPGSQKGTGVRRFITAAVRRHVKRAERMKERGNTMIGNFLAAVAGVAAATLDKHEQQAKWVVYAIALSLLFVTFPLAFLGMSVYASANLISADWPQWQQYAVVLAAAVGWALVVVFGVDRTLLVMSDAVDSRNKFGVIAMLLVRFVLAFVLSSLVADEIILVLMRQSKLKVIGRTSAFQFRGAKKLDAASVLHASHVLDGAVRRHRRMAALRIAGDKQLVMGVYVVQRVECRQGPEEIQGHRGLAFGVYIRVKAIGCAQRMPTTRTNAACTQK